jgi:hypothetical protein
MDNVNEFVANNAAHAVNGNGEGLGVVVSTGESVGGEVDLAWSGCFGNSSFGDEKSG